MTKMVYFLNTVARGRVITANASSVGMGWRAAFNFRRTAFLARLALLGLFLGCVSTSWGWRSTLYPEDWMPSGGNRNFYTDAFLQDFSHAGYRGGNEPIPDIAGPVVNVVDDYGADPTGEQDSTLKIQAAIDAVGAAGGGVVYLPAGTYRISLQGANTYVLRINLPNVVLRGAGVDKTFLFNTSVAMRSKNIIVVQGPAAASLTAAGSASSLITFDLNSPTTKIPVANGSLFAVGDWVTVRTDTTPAWIEEHKVSHDDWWKTMWRGHGATLGGLAYRRQVVAVSGNTVTLDVPTRYAVKTRDNARLVKNTHSGLTEVGLEDFSIGNQQRASTPGSAMGGWDTNDYNSSARAAYQAHASYAVRFFQARDCWMRNVASYQPAGNTTTAHLLSNGVRLDNSHRVTLSQCHFQRPQYGGAGGNGYMFRLNNSSDCLLTECRATFSRHGFVFASMRATGNVFYRCTDTDTARALGMGNHGNPYLGYETNGRGSDHHMHFSHSNLIDTCTANNSVFSAIWRPFGTSEVNHYLTAAHSVYWNTEGLGGSGYPEFPHDLVQTEQGRYGYAIGTRGTRPGVNTLVNDTKLAKNGGPSSDLHYTAPADWVEGVGAGNTLEPFSLYQDQVSRRLKSVYLPESLVVSFPNTSVVVSPGVLAGGGDTDTWTLVEGPGNFSAQFLEEGRARLSFGKPGVYTVRLDAVRDGNLSSATITITVQASLAPTATVSLPLLADSYIYDGAAGTNYGGSLQLELKSQGGSGNQRQIVQKFDLAPLIGRGVVQQVTWKATANAFSVPANSWNFTTVRIPTTWTETGITWNNAHLVRGVAGFWQLDGNREGSFDATIAVLAALGEERTIAFRHYDTLATQAAVLRFPSKESGSPGVATLDAVVAVDPLGFVEWAAARLPEGQRSAADDPDGDGLPNAVEYVLGGDPTDGSDADAFGVTARSDGHITLSYSLLRRLSAGVGVVIEHSSTLHPDDWRPLSVDLHRGPFDDARDLVVSEFQDLAALSRFFRLRVTLGDPVAEVTSLPVKPLKQISLPESLTVDFPGNSVVVTPDFLAEGDDDSDTWTLVSGPGGFTADLLENGSSRISFSKPGTYTVRLDAVREDGSSSATVTVDVRASVAYAERKTFILPTLADSYVYYGAPTTNYGTATSLALKSQNGPSAVRHIVQKFDLTPLQGYTVRQATWKATANELSSGVSTSSWVFTTERIPINWTETGITWNNAPGSLGIVAKDWKLNGSRQGSFNATAAVVAALSAEQPEVAFRHYDTLATQTSVLNFPSKEAGDAGVAVLEVEVLADFAGWATENLPEGQRSATNDLDGDGLPNAVEYVLGGDPTRGADASPLGVTAQADGRIALSYPLSRELGEGVGVVVEYSTTLRADDWYPLPATLQQGPLDVTRDLVVLEFQDDPAIPRRFFRLKVSLGDPAVEITTPPVGYTRTTLLAESDTFTGVSLTRPPLFRGMIEGATDNTLTVRDADWGDAELAYQAGVQPNTYYVRIGAVPGNPEHLLEGRVFTVSGNVSNMLVLEVEEGASLAGLPAGTPVTLIPYWTLDTLFPASDLGMSFEQSATAFSRKTSVLFSDYAASGINKMAAERTYFHLNGGWRRVGASINEDHGDIPIPVGRPFTVRSERVEKVLTLTVPGMVELEKQAMPLRAPTAIAEQDNVLVTSCPVPLQLKDLNLGGTTAFETSPSSFSRRDQLFLFSNAIAAKNRSASATYYYMNGAWRKVGAPVSSSFDEEMIAPDAAFVIRKKSSTDVPWKTRNVSSQP